jgi:hypothetical protein
MTTTIAILEGDQTGQELLLETTDYRLLAKKETPDL